MTETLEAAAPPRKRRRLRFSLRSLLIFTLLAATCMSAYFRWVPWRRVGTAPFTTQALSADLRRALLHYAPVSDGPSVYRVVVQEVDSGRVIMPELKLDDNLDKAEFSPDGQCLAIFDRWKKKCTILNPERPDERHEIQLPPAPRYWTIYAYFSPDSSLLSMNRNNGATQRLDVYSFATKKFVLNIEGGQLLEFSPNSELLLLTTEEGVFIYRSSGEKVCEFKTDYTIRSSAFSADFKQVVLAGGDSKIHVYTVANGRESEAFECPVEHAQHPLFTADGRYFATGCDDNYKVWDVSLKKPIYMCSIYCSLLRASPDDARILIRMSDKAYISRVDDGFNLGRFDVEQDNRASPFGGPDYKPPPSITPTSPNGCRIALAAGAGYDVFERCRPEFFLGMPYPAECWAAAVLFLMLIVSFYFDWRPRANSKAAAL